VKLRVVDPKHKILKVILENQDDLWHLYNIIELGDLVKSETMREIKVSRGEDVMKGSRVKMVLGVRVEQVEFQKFTGKLRIRGRIRDAPERYESLIGAYHTLTVGEDSQVVFEEKELDRRIQDRLNRASKVKRPEILLIGLSDGDAAIAVYRDIGLQVLLQMSRNIPGKREGDDSRFTAKQSLYKELYNALAEVLQREQHLSSIVIAGPGFWKNEFLNHIRQQNSSAAAKVVLENCSYGGLDGIKEALRRDVVEKISHEGSAQQERLLLEEVYRRLGNSEGLVTYGMNEVKEAAGYGAVDTLISTNSMLADSEKRGGVEEIMQSVESKGGRVRIIGDDDEALERLNSLGGVAATLRYKFK
jgi:protein pelota